MQLCSDVQVCRVCPRTDGVCGCVSVCKCLGDCVWPWLISGFCCQTSDWEVRDRCRTILKHMLEQKHTHIFVICCKNENSPSVGFIIVFQWKNKNSTTKGHCFPIYVRSLWDMIRVDNSECICLYVGVCHYYCHVVQWPSLSLYLILMFVRGFFWVLLLFYKSI